MSIIIIVLVFSESPYFVRKILQGEENKGVEPTVGPCNGSIEGEYGQATGVTMLGGSKVKTPPAETAYGAHCSRSVTTHVAA
jgi:hypothetical protein